MRPEDRQASVTAPVAPERCIWAGTLNVAFGVHGLPRLPTDRDARTGTEQVRGTISSVAFDSGDQFVIGCWAETPVGPLVDVMWRDPSGRRSLIVPSDVAAGYVTSIYEFDTVDVTPLRVESDGRDTVVESDQLSLKLFGGWIRRVPSRRSRWFTERIEAPIARRLMNVEVYGVSPLGVREWYQSSGWTWVRRGEGALLGQDLGEMAQIDHQMDVGFSNPPARPSVVSIRVLLDREPIESER